MPNSGRCRCAYLCGRSHVHSAPGIVPKRHAHWVAGHSHSLVGRAYRRFGALEVGRLERSLGAQMARSCAAWSGAAAPAQPGARERDRLLAAGLRCAELRGSVASGTADCCSDVDLCWVVPDEMFAAAVEPPSGVRSACAVASLRIDPDLAQSDRRRIICLRLVGTPLFWRVDLDIRATSGAVDDDYGAANPGRAQRTGMVAARQRHGGLDCFERCLIVCASRTSTVGHRPRAGWIQRRHA